MTAKITRTTEYLPDGLYAVYVGSTIGFVLANDTFDAHQKACVIYGCEPWQVTPAITVQDTEVKR